MDWVIEPSPTSKVGEGSNKILYFNIIMIINLIYHTKNITKVVILD